MNFSLLLEWDEQCGILLSKMYPLIDGVENALRQKDYGASVLRISAIMICRPRDFKQRMRFKKDTEDFMSDTMLDFYLIKNVATEEEKAIIRRQMIEVTEQTFSKNKFDDFDVARFLTDFNEIVNSVVW